MDDGDKDEQRLFLAQRLAQVRQEKGDAAADEYAFRYAESLVLEDVVDVPIELVLEL